MTGGRYRPHAAVADACSAKVHVRSVHFRYTPSTVLALYCTGISLRIGKAVHISVLVACYFTLTLRMVSSEQFEQRLPVRPPVGRILAAGPAVKERDRETHGQHQTVRKRARCLSLDCICTIPRNETRTVTESTINAGII